MELVSFQINGIPKSIWKLLKKRCVEQEISANKLLLKLIAEEAARQMGDELETKVERESNG